MKLLVDAVGGGYGGIATYVTNLLGAWAGEFPEDEIRVLRARGDGDLGVPGVRVEALPVGRPELVSRPLRQTIDLRRIAREWAPDAVLAARPATTLLRAGVPLAVVVHDLRHELRPEQFPLARRAIRVLSYNRAYAVADGYVCISRRTLGDLHRRHPRLLTRPAAVVHHGADHALGWPRRGGEAYVLAFGYHTNKNVELVVQAWARLVRDGTVTATTPKLNVVGLADETRAELEALVARLGIGAHVVLSPYLHGADFHAVMADSAAVIFPSDFEGFGLPAVEAMQLGKPVVVGPDEAVQEVTQGHAITMSAFTVDALADAVARALAESPADLAAARDYVSAFTWARTARQTREFLLSL